MASVWFARQCGKHGFEKLVAIKTILPKFADDIRFQQMLLDEARIASRIEHPNVAHILDLGEEHEILYFAMEYVDGDALSKLGRACRDKSITIPTGVILRVLADVCAGLHEAHELKDPDGKPLEIVHRDVTPHNILVSTKGIAKLIDFGIAKARSRVGDDTGSGIFKGKVKYMAPEQALGDPIDRRADVWAVGSTLYHLLTGKPAYDGDGQLATLQLLGSGQPPAPLPSSVHPSIAAVVRRALAHAPEDRYATASELREALEEAMIEAKVPTSVSDVAAFAAEHLSEHAERRRRAISVALAAATERERVDCLLESTGEHSFIRGRTPLSASQPVRIPDAPAPVPPQPQPRKGVVAVVALFAVAAVGTTGVPTTMFRPKPQPVVAETNVPKVPPPPTQSASAPTPNGLETPSATSSASSPSGIPTFAVSDLPKAAPRGTWTPPPHGTPPPSPRAIAANAQPKRKGADGF
jgi:serine/threonine-protein kinase